MSRYTVRDYLAEPITAGGVTQTRGEFIREMREAGHPQRVIDMYLFGLERGQQARAAAAASEVTP